MKFDPEQRPVADSPAVSVSVLRHRLSHSLSDTGWRQDLLLFWLFRTSTRLQIALDWCFSPSGLTMQEARVLYRCVEARGMKAGRLANSLGKDKGQISRIVDHLVSARLVSRDVDERDRRCSVIVPTDKGRKKAEELGHIFENVPFALIACLFFFIRGLNINQFIFFPNLHSFCIGLAYKITRSCKYCSCYH